MGRRLGLIIGVNQYQDATFQPLQFAETDARALAQWLVNTKGGKWSPPDVQLAQGAHATRELVESLIIQTCVNEAGPGDQVLIYFAGHAFLDERSGEGYLALAKTRYHQPATGLHLLSLARQAIGNSRATHVVFMLDCFQTGQIWSMRRSSPYDSKPLLGPTILNALQQERDRMIFCSCRGNELAPEVGERNLGQFAYRMILGLCGPARDPAIGQITLKQLHTFLFSALGEQHRPQLFGQEQNPLVLVGAMPSPAPAPQNTSSSAGFPFAAPTATPYSPNGQSLAAGQLVAQAAHYSAAAAQIPHQISPTTSGLLPSLMSSTTSGQLSLSTAEQQLQQQCTTLMRQAHYLLQLPNPGEAFNIVEQVLQIAPAHIDALILKGQLLGTVGRFQEAMYTAEQVVQLDPGNALAWSMCAALLTNMGQYQDALVAVEHSLDLDPNNPETYAIKTSIQVHIATSQGIEKNQQFSAKNRGGPVSFFIGTAIQIFALLIGGVGAALPILQPGSPIVASFVLESLGLAILCVNAARGSYLYGVARLLLTLFMCVIPAAVLGGLYKFEYTRLIQAAKDHPSLLVPILFLAVWLAAAATVPLVLAIGGFIGFIVRLIVGKFRSN